VQTNMMKGLWGLAVMLMMAALFLIFVYVPTEANMGIVQRIFYFHVPLAWLAFLAFFIVFIGSILYLVKRDSKWDRLAYSSAEVGVVFTTLFLIAGSVWAKPIWGVWWTWEPRLTAALILWIIYIAYLLVRSYVSNKEQGARFGAVIGIVGFLDVPIVSLAITLWRTEHPSALIFQGGMAPSMLLTLIISLLAFTVLFALLLSLRLSTMKMDFEVRRIKNILADHTPDSSSEDS
jgi:heme exporter protein C